MVAQLRDADPSCRITVVTMRPTVRDLYLALPALVDRVIDVPFWERGKTAAAFAALGLPFSTASEASFLTFPAARAEYALFSRFIWSRRHYAHEYLRKTPARFARTDTVLVPIREEHNVLRNLDLLRAAGIATKPPAGYVVPPAWLSARVRPNRVLVHIGSIAHDGLENKRWPASSFLALARDLKRRSFDVAFLAGPAEREETQLLARDVDAQVIEGDLPFVARTISESGALIANDSGIAHLAAGVGTPVVALMGPTPVEFGPFGANAVPLRPSSCPPCFDYVATDIRCVRDIDYACLKRDIHVDDVTRALSRLLEPQPTGASTQI